MLGVTLFFVNPRNCNSYRIPIGLVETKGHTAVQIATHTESLLLTIGFTKDDVAAAINDNTNSAILASKYIVGSNKGGKCDMHRAELIMKHATGQAVRRRGKVVIDENKEFTELYKVVHIFASWLMSSKKRSRFEKLRQWAMKNGRVIIEIPIPNATRIGSCIIMIHGLIRNKFVMDDYASSSLVNDPEFKAKYLTLEQWDQLIEYEAVLNPVQKCGMTLQTDNPSAASASLLEIFLSKHCVEQMTKKGIQVLDTKSTPWDASSTMAALQQKKRHQVSHALLEEPTQNLIQRILREYRFYMMEEKDEDAEKAMIGNPFLCGWRPKLFKKMGIFSDVDFARIQGHFVADMMDKFYYPLPVPNQESAGSDDQTPADNHDNQNNQNNATDGTTAETAEHGPEVTTVGAVADEFDIFDELALGDSDDDSSVTNNNEDELNPQAREAERKKKLEKELIEEYQEYKKHCEKKVRGRWADLINRHPTNLYLEQFTDWNGATKAWFAQQCAKDDFMSVGKYFDVLGWWEANKNTFPHVFVTSLVWLGKPATNAFQERVFSSSSWFDNNPLMNRESASNFQMRTLGYVTRPVVKKILVAEEELRKKQPVLHFEDGDKKLPARSNNTDASRGRETGPTESVGAQGPRQSQQADSNGTATNGTATNGTAMASVTTRTTSESRNGSSVQVPCDGTDGLQVDTMLSTVGVLRDYMNKTVQAGPEDMPEYGFLKESSDNKKEPTEEDMDFADTIEFIDLTGGSKEAVTGTDEAMDDDDLLVEMLKEHLVVNTDSTSADASMVGLTATASTTRGSKTGSKSSRKRKDPPIASSSEAGGEAVQRRTSPRKKKDKETQSQPE